MPARKAKGPDAFANESEVEPAEPEQVASSGESTVLEEMVSGPSEPSP